MKYIVIDGKRYEWKELRRLRRAQIQAARRTAQPTLFPVREDSRPASQTTANGRFREPLLWDK